MRIKYDSGTVTLLADTKPDVLRLAEAAAAAKADGYPLAVEIGECSMSEPPLKQTAEQYEAVIHACKIAKREDAHDDFEAAKEAFLALEPSSATTVLAIMFRELNGSLDKMREIIGELYRLRNRAQREEGLERQRRRPRG